MPDDSLHLLQQLGFTAYEGKAWLALTQAADGPLTGYEVAKRSAIPRANVYAVLKRLVERGAARQLDTHDGARYLPTPTSQLLASLEREQRQLLTRARAALPQQSSATGATPVYALTSTSQLHTAALHLIAATHQQLFVAVHPQEAALLAPELRKADARGVHITTLCMEACDPECGGCFGNLCRCAAPMRTDCRWLLLAADDSAAVAAEFGPEDHPHAIETHQHLLVELIASYIRQSAALALLGGAAGDRFDGLVSLQTHQLLDDLRLNGSLFRQATPTTEKASVTRPETGIQPEDSP
ncbi:MAG TPA: helix-turn-helix domain-containing protein [Nevskiaceae bacterium]|nr:helix-turn-helix domain-containing protein [Nevskiaceae bacterium]